MNIAPQLSTSMKTELSALAKCWLDASADPDSATALGEIEIELEQMLIAAGVMDEYDCIYSIEPLALGNIATGARVRAIALTFEQANPLTITE